ncbi:MAG: class I SAM-dependent methyltransferase [Candidatus Electrothrix sp. ATG1]|nr:class I SAM-dependent methyltransferase [Candidatus Electrothrix sp. ATG1]
MAIKEYWDNFFSNKKKDRFRRVGMPDSIDEQVLQRALMHFGSVSGKTVIDLGCGRGAASLFFASYGANVISIDLSQVAINNLSVYCKDNDIRNIIPISMPAQEIEKIGKADFIFGSMILHHIEPLDEFTNSLRGVLKQEGKGFFWENNACNKMLIWFR